MQTIYIEAWRDYFINIEAYTEYYIMDNKTGKVIYDGVAEPIMEIPSSGINAISIVRDYIDSKNTFDDELEDNDSVADVTVYLNGTAEYRFFIINDWSYDYDGVINQGITLTSTPVNGHFDSRMYVPLSLYRQARGADVLVGYSSSEHPYSEEIMIPGDGAYTDWIKGMPDDVQSIWMQTPTESVTYGIRRCGRGVLYYLNVHGGYDAFLLENNIYENDNIDASTYTTSFNNNNPHQYGVTRYIQNIRKTYNTTSGWLDDKQSENLANNLFTSPQVYYHDLETGVVYSANIENTTVTHKRFKNGRVLNSYDIDFSISQNRTRR